MTYLISLRYFIYMQALQNLKSVTFLAANITDKGDRPIGP